MAKETQGVVSKKGSKNATQAPADVHQTSALPDDEREASALAGYKTIGSAPAFLHNMMMTNTVHHQHRLQQIAETALAKSLEGLQNLSAMEAGGPAVLLGQLIEALKVTQGEQVAEE